LSNWYCTYMPTAPSTTYFSSLSLHDALPILLVAGSPFDQSFFCVGGLHAVVARNAHDFRHDRQAAKFGMNLVERQPDLAACRSRSEDHTSELQSRENLVCRLLLEKKKKLPPI